MVALLRICWEQGGHKGDGGIKIGNLTLGSRLVVSLRWQLTSNYRPMIYNFLLYIVTLPIRLYIHLRLRMDSLLQSFDFIFIGVNFE